MNKEKKAMRLVAILLAAIVVLVFLPTGAFAAPYKDIEGHWAQEQINDWLERGLAGGYPDGTFRPDHPVSRAEFATFANRAFDIRGEGEGVGFTDVPSDAWYFTQVAAAQKAGYISGYPDGTFRPDSPISRQEAAVIVARLLGLAGAGVVDKFADHQEISPWAKEAVEAVFAAGLMGGYPDGTFRPQNFITRAETVVTLQKAQNLHGAQVVFDQPGVYGPEEGRETIAGDVVVNSPEVTLQNITITGDLLLAEGIGQGDVTLRGVTVRGETIVKGGGANSINIEDSTLARLTVAKDGVRILASGSTRVSVTTLESGAVLVSVVQDYAEGFGTVAVSEKIPAGAKITLEGDFATVNVKGAISEIEIAAGNVKELNVEAPVKITGKGTITTANVEAEGIEFEKAPENLNVAEGVTVKVEGKEVEEKKHTVIGGGGSTRKTVSLEPIDPFSLKVGEVKEIILITNATSITAETVNGNVAKVDVDKKDDGFILKVTGKSPGTTEISVTGSRGGYNSRSRSFTVTVQEKEEAEPIVSTYRFSCDVPEEVFAAKGYNVAVTLEPETVGERGYDSVRFNVEVTTPEGGTLQLLARDEAGTYYDVAEIGYWGPEEGFPIEKDYRATTEFTALFSAAGEYTITLKLVDLKTNIDITMVTLTISVLEPEFNVISNVLQTIIEVMEGTGQNGH